MSKGEITHDNVTEVYERLDKFVEETKAFMPTRDHARLANIVGDVRYKPSEVMGMEVLKITHWLSEMNEGWDMPTREAMIMAWNGCSLDITAIAKGEPREEETPTDPPILDPTHKPDPPPHPASPLPVDLTGFSVHVKVAWCRMREDSVLVCPTNEEKEEAVSIPRNLGVGLVEAQGEGKFPGNYYDATLRISMMVAERYELEKYIIGVSPDTGDANTARALIRTKKALNKLIKNYNLIRKGMARFVDEPPPLDGPVNAPKYYLPEGHELRATTNEEIRQRSGEVDTKDRFAMFLYLLMRDHLNVGEVEDLVIECEKTYECQFTNGWLGQYTVDLSDRIKRPPLEKIPTEEDQAQAWQDVHEEAIQQALHHAQQRDKS